MCQKEFLKIIGFVTNVPNDLSLSVFMDLFVSHV